MSSPFNSRKSKKGLRWCPPKPKVTYGILDKLLRRHMPVQSPEARLVTAVIARAIADGIHRDPRIRSGARRFVQGDALEHWCDWVGLHPEAVREIAVKAGYLPSEEAHWVKPPKARTAKTAKGKPGAAKRLKRPRPSARKTKERSLA